MKTHMRQYLVAVTVALGLCAIQAWEAAQRFGVGGASPRADVMQQQIIEHVFGTSSLGVMLLLFAMLFLASHLLLTVGSVTIYRSATRIIYRDKREHLAPCVGFLSAVVLLAMFGNLWLFPLSSAFAGVEVLMIQALSPLLIGGLILIAGCGSVCALYSWISSARRRWLPIAAIAVSVLLIAAWHNAPDADGGALRYKRPDVIVLGVDSLRPEYVSAYGDLPAGLTPAIDEVLRAGVVVEDARTPLARTFVSYQSLLTGSNPVKHGARFNLYPRTEFDSGRTLAWQLKREGYATMLAMDESRFANFDASFGFDTTIVPTVGAVDFVVGGTFDFLATNLLISILPPTARMSVVQGNRAAYRSYRPEDHPTRVLKALREVPINKPLFLVSHLCLPHWPYLPAGVEGDTSLDWVKKVPGFSETSTQYLRAIAVADAQFAKIVDELRRLGRLENAVLVIMSDHGEDFAFQRDRLWVDRVGNRQVGAHGHGSFALSTAQNHVVMGIQRYRDGKVVWSPRSLKGAASIIDVAPTIAAELGMAEGGYEGTSWLPMLRARSDLPTHRVRYFENGLRSAGVERPTINESEVAAEMSYLYRVTEDGRFEIRPELLPQKLREKQRGATLGRWGVMTDPASSSALGAADCWQGLDYEQRVIGCVDFPAVQPEVAFLQKEVCRYFASDPDFVYRWCLPGTASTLVSTALH